MAARRSLLRQIVAANGSAVFAAILLVSIASMGLLRDIAADYRSLSLQAQADGIAGEFRRLPPDRRHESLSPAFGAAYASPFSGRLFAILAENGRVLLNRGEPSDVIVAARSTEPGLFHTGEIASLKEPLDVPGGRFWIIASHDMRSPGAISDDVESDFLSRFILLLAPILVLVLLFNLLVIRRSTVAIRAEADVARSIGPEAPQLRVAPERLPDEIAPLATAINGALDRLEATIRSRTEFVGNVAHELRTPLATLKLELDAVTDPGVREKLTRLVDRASHVVAQLFKLAVLEELAVDPGETFDLSEIARSAVETVLPAIISAEHTVALDVPSESVRVRGRAQLAEVAISNLLDNATRHTPEGTAINISVKPDGRVIVSDNGPGLTGIDIGRATERYWRKDHSRSDSAGLGLAIVTRVMTALDGRLEVTNGPNGGAQMTLAFRPPSQSSD